MHTCDAWAGDQHGLGEELYDRLLLSPQKTRLEVEAEAEVGAERVVARKDFDGSLEWLQRGEINPFCNIK